MTYQSYSSSKLGNLETKIERYRVVNYVLHELGLLSSRQNSLNIYDKRKHTIISLCCVESSKYQRAVATISGVIICTTHGPSRVCLGSIFNFNLNFILE